MVEPVPLIVELLPFQVSVVITVTAPAPVSVPPDRFNVAMLTVLAIFAVPELMLSVPPRLVRLPLNVTEPPSTVVVPVTLYVPASPTLPLPNSRVPAPLTDEDDPS